MCGDFTYESVRSHYLSIYISFIVPLCTVPCRERTFLFFCKVVLVSVGLEGVNDMFYVTGLEAIHVDNFKEFGFYNTKIGF